MQSVAEPNYPSLGVALILLSRGQTRFPLSPHGQRSVAFGVATLEAGESASAESVSASQGSVGLKREEYSHSVLAEDPSSPERLGRS